MGSVDLIAVMFDCTRSPVAAAVSRRLQADSPRLDSFRAWSRWEHQNFRFVPVLSEPAPEDHWTGRQGLVHAAILADFADLSGNLADVAAIRPTAPAPDIDVGKPFGQAGHLGAQFLRITVFQMTKLAQVQRLHRNGVRHESAKTS